MTSEGRVFTSEGRVLTSDGRVFTSDGRVFTSDGRVFTINGRLLAINCKYGKIAGYENSCYLKEDVENINIAKHAVHANQDTRWVNKSKAIRFVTTFDYVFGFVN